MAADKALIAGAAKVAGAKANLDYATTKGLTDAADEIVKASESILTKMQETQDAYTKLYEADVDDINKNQYNTDKLVGGLFMNEHGLKVIQEPTGLAMDELKKQGAQTFDFTEALKGGILQEAHQNSQKYVNIANGENDKLNEDKKIFNKNYKKSPLVEISDERYKMFMALHKGEANWGPFTEPILGKSGEGKLRGRNNADKFKYKVNIDGKDVYYTTAQMDEARRYVFQRNDSQSIRDVIEDSSERQFKTAANNKQANGILDKEKESLFKDKERLEKLATNLSGMDIDALKEAFIKDGKFDEIGYKKQLEEIGGRFLQEQMDLHYTPPEVDEPEEDKYIEAKNFITNMALDTGEKKYNSVKAMFEDTEFVLNAQNAGIVIEPEIIIEGTGDDATEVPTGYFLAVHMSNTASSKYPIRISPSEPIEAVKGRLAGIYKF